ncbi:hypothetical protein ACJW31_02G028900 [Castanea mollissima]
MKKRNPGCEDCTVLKNYMSGSDFSVSNQNNVLLSLRFFHWLCSLNGFSPDPLSLKALFDALVEAKACNAAKSFIDYTGFKPEPASSKLYIQCLFEGGLVEEAFDVFDILRGVGVCPSIAARNSALLGCLKVGRTDLVWKLYKEMVESSVVAKVAFCEDNKVSKGYELLRQVLEDRLDPANAAFNELISGFCKERQYSKVSELLHTMIAKNRDPDIFTHQEVINGLCKQRKQLEAFRVFNDLKDRGYAPDRVMYTTMIHGLCKMGWLGDARKLWFEMIQKGFIPNEYTYSALIHGVCLNGRMNEAHELFEEMPRKGVVCDVITYNTLIQGFCKEGKIVESTNLLKELLMQGLQPSTSSFSPLIEKLCQAGDIQEAKSCGMICKHIITGLCNQGYAAEGMDWLLAMLKCKLKPKKETFERLVQCLSQSDKWDDILLVLDIMFRIGYTLREGICHSLVNKLCRENYHFVETHPGEIVE